MSELHSGYSVLIKNIKLKEIEDYKNPGSFSLKKHFKNQGILYTAFINNNNQLEVTGYYSYFSFKNRINKFRKSYENFVRGKIDYPNNEIIIALTVGEKGGIPEELKSKFSYLGISHLFAISGLHIGFIGFLFYFVINWFLKRSKYLLLMYEVPKIASLITIFPIFLYTAIAGFATPVVRAFIMISLYLFSIFLGKQDNKANILATAALIILIFDSSAIKSLSFQLSFLAVGGILLFNKIFPMRFSSLYEKFLSLIKTTIAATLFTLPLVINSFGFFPISSIPANFVAVPLVEFLIVPLGFISILLYLVSHDLAEFTLKINEKFVSLIVDFVEKAASFKYVQMTVQHIDFAGYVLLAFVFLSLILILVSNKAKYVALIFFTIFSIYIITHRSPGNGNLEINFLDSGNKTYALINTHHGKNILISSGYSHYGESDFIEKAALVPFLLKKGITRIDYLWLFSTDKSRLKGANAILERIKVKSIWTNGAKLNGKLWRNIKENDIIWKNFQASTEKFVLGNTKFSFIKPRGVFKIYDSKHPKPIILIVENNDNKIIIGEGLDLNSVQEELIEIYNDRIKSDVIYINMGKKSNILRKFIESVDPDFLITKNSKNYLESFLQNDIKIYETKSDGMITFNSNNEGIDVIKYIN
ncbi:MAG: DNA internalization-related competence protein ComEC/Rec2 [Candidatus Dadabacteria bacterium]|nr:DNA internalization-related competence protein ComEC/Rec2 [Candidatus Dadabacteria bacterium]NIQ13207.1 DNA internalization-related competence protein ComEC/Rec2 [Candidatus Dadabacteria bacterium]